MVDVLGYGLCEPRASGYYRSIGHRVLVYFAQKVELLCSDAARRLDQVPERVAVEETVLVYDRDRSIDSTRYGRCRVVVESLVRAGVVHVPEAVFDVYASVFDDDHRSLVRLLHDDVGAFAQSLEGGAFGRVQILEDLVSRPRLGQSSSRSRYVRLEGGVFRGRRLPFRDRSERRRG